MLYIKTGNALKVGNIFYLILFKSMELYVLAYKMCFWLEVNLLVKKTEGMFCNSETLNYAIKIISKQSIQYKILLSKA